MTINDKAKEKRWFFEKPLSEVDPEIAQCLEAEDKRQREEIELIAPKNYLSHAAREAMDSMITYATVEGYPGKRYHAGVENIDTIENLAIERAKKLFGAGHANMQPHSGTQCNQAIFFALLQPGDCVLSMDLKCGGHLSHGLKNNLSGRWFDVHSYGLRPDGYIDYDEMEQLALEHNPKLIIVGGSSYPRAIDFPRVAEIAKKVGAKTLADISHFSGLVAAGVYPSPFPHLDFVTSTTNKNMRGPRGGMILCRDAEMGKKIDSAIFPGIQGGPHPNVIAAKAVTFGEALQPEFKVYAQTVLDCARAIARTLEERGFDIVTGGTDTPMIMVDLRPKGITGDVAEEALEAYRITTNKNLIPNDPEKPGVTSGLRIGASAIAARGMGVEEAEYIGTLIADILEKVAANPEEKNKVEPELVDKVTALAKQFPIY